MPIGPGETTSFSSTTSTTSQADSWRPCCFGTQGDRAAAVKVGCPQAQKTGGAGGAGVDKCSTIWWSRRRQGSRCRQGSLSPADSPLRAVFSMFRCCQCYHDASSFSNAPHQSAPRRTDPEYSDHLVGQDPEYVCVCVYLDSFGAPGPRPKAQGLLASDFRQPEYG